MESTRSNNEEPTAESRLKRYRQSLGEELQDEIPLYIFNIMLTERKFRLAVKFTTKDGGIFAQSFLPDTDFERIKTVVATVIQVKPRRLKTNEIKLKLMKPELLDEFKNDPHEALTCMIDSATFLKRLTLECPTRSLLYRIILYNRAIDKPWDGGYRDTRTGIEYYNAFSQTGPRPPVRCPTLMNSRDTQTSWCRNRKLDMPYSRATQMYRKDLYIPSITDRILTSGKYETWEERSERLNTETSVRTIQKYYRAWRMRRYVREMSLEYRRRLNRQIECERAEKEEDWRRRRKDLICQVFPRSRIDFAMLYAMAEKWKKGETCEDIVDEIELFRAVDKLQQEVRRDTRKQNDLNYLKKLGDSTKWYCSYKYIPVQLDSLENQKARKIDDLYQKVVNRKVSEPKRMDALLELKLSLKNDDCEISFELNRLIDRALDLLSRGFSNKKIESVQKRIDATLLYHFKRKECFDELNSRREKERAEFMRTNLFVCNRCQQIKTVDFFRLNARTEKISMCNACKWLDRTEEPWADLSPYRFILTQIRRSERINNSPSSVAYILQDRDIYHLITQIWHAHSAVSECKDIYNLRLVRWRKDVDWSPWNCILLTLQEGKAHVKIENLEEVYEEEFINHIFNKHALAKQHFKALMPIENQFKSMYKVSSVHNLDVNGYNDYRKIFKIDRTKRLYF
ncbi:hypothetical protein WA026_007276 [Henosepilachna vigintioctopunctata]|uniref:IQ motif and ubiquitin-like domain-containing protein n=1 Tax=Henosepilachna vigintioctopunctata TaxID=420089 RepID=A0AAW1UXX4_9CUCU